MKWIDVSDKLPVASQMVLVSYPAYADDAGNEYVECVGIGYLITTATDKIWCRSDGTTFGELGFTPIEPVAWMPLPMPLKSDMILNCRKGMKIEMTNQEAIRILNEQRNKFMDEWVDFGGVNEAYNTAIALLQQQEPVLPRVSSVEQRCGNCNKIIEMDGWKACPWCGKPIDWKGWWKKNG